MSRAVAWGLILGLGIIAAAAWWLYGMGAPDTDHDAASDRPPATSVDYVDPSQPDEREAPAPPPRQYPLVETPTDGSVNRDGVAPLPALAQSDDALRQSLSKLPTRKPIESLLVPDRLIEKLVVTVSNLDGRLPTVSRWPVGNIQSRPAVQPLSEEGRYRWLPDNAARYDDYVAAFTTPEAETLAALYLRYYPLMQEAYDELGLGGRYFNDRVIAIIDHLLEAPAARAEYTLVQPKVLYRFADPELESLSAGQKLMLRLGPAHSQAVRAQLRELRAAIIARTQPPDDDE